MIRTDIDETLAFTFLFEADPDYRHMRPETAAQRRDALLAAWWSNDWERSFWNFARTWLVAQPHICHDPAFGPCPRCS